FKMLQDVFDNFAKKLCILLDIKDLNATFISKLNSIFQVNKGNNSVTFDIVELETVKKQVEIIPEIIKLEPKTDIPLFDDEIPEETVIFSDEFSEDDELSMGEPLSDSVSIAEETKIITRISMPSRKLKIKILNELLVELEKMDVNFKLN
ncbi:MAG TPA: hypothetical protein PLB11_10210, partial [Flavobacterium sp.]|nr:hypothetical protein [Flavobacterium sp.]